MRAAVLLLALLALGLALVAASAPAAAQAKASARRVAPPQPGQNDGPDDVHVFLKQVVSGDAAGQRVADAESRFHAGHARVMRRLNKLAAKLSSKQPALVELQAEAEAPVVPIIDDTGSAVEVPRANLTQFKVKPAIDATLVQDPSLARLEAEADSRRAAAEAAQRAFIDRMRARVAAAFGVPMQQAAPAMVQPAAPPAVPVAPAPAVDVVPSAPPAVPTVAAAAASLSAPVVSFGTVLPSAQGVTLVAPPELIGQVPTGPAANVVPAPTTGESTNTAVAQPLAIAAALPAAPEAALLETEAEAEAEAELEAEAEAEAEADSDSWVDAELTESGGAMIDAEISAIEMQAEAEAPVVPIIDDTGSAVEVPRANLTQFKVKPAIDATLVQDAPVARLEAEAEARRLARATAVDSMKARIQAAWAAAAQANAQALSSFGPPPVPGSLLETQSGDCPTCVNGAKRQSWPVQYVAGSDALIDRPLIEEQHKRVDYMLGEARSIKQADLDDARTQLTNSKGVREEVQNLMEKNQNQPLIPRD